jgi:hypothetical protein
MLSLGSDLTRTNRSMADAGITLSASTVMARSYAAPKRAQKSWMLPALKPVFAVRRR